MVLLTALYDVTRLNENFIGAEILDLQLTHIAGLVHPDGPFRERLFKRERHWTWCGLAVHPAQSWLHSAGGHVKSGDASKL
jgi:hypothetical protein